MSNDSQLLRSYVGDQSDSAFTELVREHLNLVYSTALRETNGDTARAEDLSQAVFTELARKAVRLLHHPSLAGWLYITVRHLAANLRRADQRRRLREQDAHRMKGLLSQDSPNEAWHQLRPVLDDALHELNEADRTAVVLRFLEDRPLREVGSALGLNENAARMRVERALDKLRALLGRRGITSTATGLAAALAVGAATSAPEALVITIASSALTNAAIASSSTLNLFQIMSLSKAKVSLVSALFIAGVALPVWQQKRLQFVRAENAELRVRVARGAVTIDKSPTQTKSEVAPSELEELRQWKARTQSELLRLRGMAGVARSAEAEVAALRSQLARLQEANSNQNAGPMGDLMKSAMKNALEQRVESQLSRMTASLHLTAEQVQAARDILLRQANAMSTGMQQAFSGKFDKSRLARLGTEAGDPDQQIQALLTPEQMAAYPNYKQEEAGANARLMTNSELLQIQPTLDLTREQEDRVFGALYNLNFEQLTGAVTPPGQSLANPADPLQVTADVMQWACEQKITALESILTPGQLATYRQQQENQLKLVKDMIEKMSAGSSSR